MRRIEVEMSQQALGGHIDLTFQQIQKYEKGMNRIGASRLQQIGKILEPPAKTAARPLCHPMGQAPSHAKLCPEFLRRARRLYARGPADYAAVVKVAGQARCLLPAHHVDPGIHRVVECLFCAAAGSGHCSS